jgi:acyl-CoA reductase-like NAD-dependent aldehyde dehydrogenase
MPSDEHWNVSTRVPIGPVGVITPWNTPFMLSNPVIVFDDADQGRALDAVVFMIYSLNGERCTSSSRLLIQDNIAEKFVEKLTARVKALKIGHPLDPSTEIGPLIHAKHLEKVCSYFDVARRDGAVIAVGGKSHDGPGGGQYVQPALVTGARADMRVAQEEVFGPFLTVIPSRRERSHRDRQRRAVWPHRLCLDRRHGAGAARRRCAGGRHDLA